MLLPLDVQLLEDIDITIISDNGALGLVDDATFVFDAFMEKQQEKLFMPALEKCPFYITASILEFIDHLIMYDHDEAATRAVTSARKILSTHDTLRFPDFEHNEHVLNLHMHIIKPVSED